MATRVTMSWLDNSAEISRSSFYLPTLAAGNFATIDGQINPATIAGLTYLIEAMSLCNTPKVSAETFIYEEPYTQPASAFAVREQKLLITYQDDVTLKKYRFEVPGPDNTMLKQPGTDYVSPISPEWVAFVAGFNANARSCDGNAVHVVSGQFVGRSI